MDKVVLVTLFVIGSYIPALLFTLVYAATCKKPEAPRYDPAMHVFNRPDAMEMSKITQMVGKL